MRKRKTTNLGILVAMSRAGSTAGGDLDRIGAVDHKKPIIPVAGTGEFHIMKSDLIDDDRGGISEI